jgi:Tetratricopeptide repeat
MRACVFIAIILGLILSSAPAFAQVSYWRVLKTYASELSADGRYEEAVPIAEKAARVASETFGREHDSTLETNDLLVDLYGFAGMTDKATALTEKTKQIRFAKARKSLVTTEKRYGSRHPKVAGKLGNLARNLKEEKEISVAEKLHLEALEITGAAKGKNHPDVAPILDDLANLYGDEKQDEKQEQALTRSLEIRKQGYGASDLRTVEAQERLAEFYFSQGRYSDAEATLKEAEPARMYALGGPTHPALVPILLNLAAAQEEQSRANPDDLNLIKLNQAEQSYRRALSLLVAQKGPNSPALLDCLTPLAEIQLVKDEPREAIIFANRAAEIQRELFGEEIPGLAVSYDQLAVAHKSLGQFAAATEYLNKSIAIREKTRGAVSFEAYESLLERAEIYALKEKFDLARSDFLRALSIRLELDKKETAASAEVHEEIAETYMAQEKWVDARAEYVVAAAVWESQENPPRARIATAQSRIAETYYHLGSPKKALSMWKATLVVQEAYLPENDPEIAITLAYIGDVYELWGSYSKAISYSEQAVAIREKQKTGFTALELATMINALAEVCVENGDKVKARQNFEKALKVLNDSYKEHPFASVVRTNLAGLDTAKGL